METIGENKIWSFLDESARARLADNDQVRRSTGHEVSSYFDLARRVAELQFKNPGMVLLFRGQGGDHKDESGRTTLKPRIFRPTGGETELPGPDSLNRRFARLRRAAELLSENYREEVERLGNTLIRRFRIVRWSILQHYEVCRTPLLDVTHSLRIAASFASIQNTSSTAYVFILGIPSISGAITVSAEAGLQVIRLTSVCPPSAMRPHVQEGYLIGEYPDIDDFEAKRLYPATEVDLGLRLVAKFKLNLETFWGSPDFPRIERPALYPPVDPIFDLTDYIRQQVRPWSSPSL